MHVLWRGCDARASSRNLTGLLGLVLSSLSFGCSKTTTERLELPPPTTVDHVDLSRYQGKWYELARFPNRFEKDCYAVTAEYTPRPDGKIGVTNRCHKGAIDGPLKTSEGVAQVVDETSKAKLKVTFFWPFSGDYWILDLADDYSYALVGSPTRDYLWVLSRTPTLPKQTYDEVVQMAQSQGYETSRLTQTPQPTQQPSQ